MIANILSRILKRGWSLHFTNDEARGFMVTVTSNKFQYAYQLGLLLASFKDPDNYIEQSLETCETAMNRAIECEEHADVETF